MTGLPASTGLINFNNSDRSGSFFSSSFLIGYLMAKQMFGRESAFEAYSDGGTMTSLPF